MYTGEGKFRIHIAHWDPRICLDSSEWAGDHNHSDLIIWASGFSLAAQGREWQRGGNKKWKKKKRVYSDTYFIITKLVCPKKI